MIKLDILKTDNQKRITVQDVPVNSIFRFTPPLNMIDNYYIKLAEWSDSLGNGIVWTCIDVKRWKPSHFLSTTEVYQCEARLEIDD